MKEVICEIPPIPPIEMMMISIVDLKGEAILSHVRPRRTSVLISSPFRPANNKVVISVGGIGGSFLKTTTICNKLEPEFAPVADLRELRESSSVGTDNKPGIFEPG